MSKLRRYLVDQFTLPRECFYLSHVTVTIRYQGNITQSMLCFTESPKVSLCSFAFHYIFVISGRYHTNHFMFHWESSFALSHWDLRNFTLKCTFHLIHCRCDTSHSRRPLVESSCHTERPCSHSYSPRSLDFLTEENTQWTISKIEQCWGDLL